MYTQPIESSQESTVHAFSSLQYSGAPGMQSLSRSHCSNPSHAIPFWHRALFGMWKQVFVSSRHASSVHPMVSPQGSEPAPQVPAALHASVPLQ